MGTLQQGNGLTITAVLVIKYNDCQRFTEIKILIKVFDVSNKDLKFTNYFYRNIIAEKQFDEIIQ